MNNDGTVNFNILNSQLSEGFEESHGIYIKEKYTYIVNMYGKVDMLLPKGYKLCEYLESTGTQYMNIGYVPTVNTNIQIKYQLPSWFNHASSYTLVGSNNLAINFYRFSGGLTTTFKKGKNATDIYKWGFNYEDIYDMSIFASDVELINSQGTYTGKIDVDFEETLPLPIFIWALNTGTKASENISGKIYYFTVLENSNVVAKFIPALDLNDRPCMFDCISRKPFYNQGSGEFLYKVK